MDEGVRVWLDKMWNTRKGTLTKKRSLPVWDMFRAHPTDATKKRTKEIRANIAVIPGGLTSVLQPLDVYLNKPFKDRLRTKWTEWMSSGSAMLTKGGNVQKPDITVVTMWVKDSWDLIPEEMVRKSFFKCGISNAMDGFEDDAIYETEQNSNADDDSADDSEDGYTDDALPSAELMGELFSEHSDDDEEFQGF